jgi:phenylacetate-CoA ligase
MVTPSYMLAIADEFERQGIDPRASSLKIGIHGAEPWTAAMRRAIEERMAMHALDIYGLSEVLGPGVANECIETKDGLHLWEDHFYPEVIDPATGEVLPDGTVGELVLTTLTKEALPLLRYRTGDIATLRRGSCPCGRTLAKMSKIAGRKDDMLVVRGVNVYPSEVERVLLAHPAIAPDYLLVVDERAPQTRLIACCELGTGSSAAGPVSSQLESGLKDALGLSVAVALLPPGTVPRTEVGKAVRVRRWPGGEPPLPGLA